MNRSGWFGSVPTIPAVVALLAATIMATAAVVAALRQHDLGPIETVGWLPAVLAATFWAPAGGRCARGRRRRVQA